MDFIGIAGLLKELYEAIKAATPAYNRVYNRALKKWTCNSRLRERYADNNLADFDKLVQFIKNDSSVNPGLVSFYEILLDEIKKDPETAASISAEFSIENYNIQNEIKEDVSYIRRVIDGLTSSRKCSIPKYADIDDYIPLNVTTDETDEERLMRILSGNEDNKSLCDLIVEGEKRLILFSHPQYGKSTVLAKLAFDLQQSNIYKPLLFNLRNYSSNLSLVEQTKLEQRLDNSSLSVLILDGLDELKAEHREDVVSEIAILSENFPLLNIVLSCRLSHKKVMTVSGFKSVYLKPMDWNGLSDYVRSHCADPEGFLNVAQESRIMELFYVPFFLKESVRYFEVHGRMPDDKVDIYEFFIDRAFEIDGRRKHQRSAILKLKPYLYPCLEHLAFVMLVSQRMEISPDDLVNDMEFSVEAVEALMGLSLITKGDNGELTFVHNAFKEYILAKRLAQLDIDGVRNLICFPGTEIIIPALKNVAVLLVHVIRVRYDWEASEFRAWFVEKHPDILIEVGSDCLDAISREAIFKQIYKEHKDKGLYLDYGRLKMLMNFASTRGSVDLVLSEIESSETFDVNYRNALRLAEYADFSLLSPERKSRVEDVLLSLLEKRDLPVGDYAYLSRPLINKTILSEKFLERVMQRIADTENCYLVMMVCSMAMSLGISDQCTSWVLPKAKYVRNYLENGATNVVSDYRLMEFIRSLSLPENILAALRYLLPDGRHYTDSYQEREKWDAVPGLLCKLHSLSDEQLLNRVIEVVDSSHLEHMPREVSEAFRQWFMAAAEVDGLFERRLRAVIEANQSKSSDFYAVWRMHNLLSILLSEEILNHLIEQDQDGEFEVYSVLCHLRDYSARTEQELSLIDAFGARKFPRKSSRNSYQEQFDILFDPLAFEQEIYRIFDGDSHIDYEKDIDKIYRSGHNSSVLSFLREVKDDDIVCIDDVLESFNDSEKFSVFVAGRIFHFAESSIHVSDKQKIYICELVRMLIPICDQWNNLTYHLMKLIAYYDIPLSDGEYMMCFAWSGMEIKEQTDGDMSYNHRWFMDFLYEHIVAKSLFVNGVKAALAGEFLVYSMFYEAVAEVVIRYRITELYAEFRAIVQKFEYSHKILDVMVQLLQLDDKGLRISGELFDMLSEEEKLYFIECLLRHENNELVLGEGAKVCALEYIESCYNTYSESAKQRALRILFAFGRESALEWGFAMFDECEAWLYADNFPSIVGYSGRHYERLAEYFHRATSGEQSRHSRPQPMYESISTALKNIAMESVEMLEKVKELFRSVAKEKKDFRYYNRVADELDVDFYSKNVRVPDLRQASLQYKRICV